MDINEYVKTLNELYTNYKPIPERLRILRNTLIETERCYELLREYIQRLRLQVSEKQNEYKRLVRKMETLYTQSGTRKTEEGKNALRELKKITRKEIKKNLTKLAYDGYYLTSIRSSVVKIKQCEKTIVKIKEQIRELEEPLEEVD